MRHVLAIKSRTIRMMIYYCVLIIWARWDRITQNAFHVFKSLLRLFCSLNLKWWINFV